MSDTADFTATLRRFMAQALRSNSDLARLTGISVRTIEKWTAGEVRRPRFGVDVLKVARALALNEPETLALLAAAGFPTLDALRLNAQQAGDAVLLGLLNTWNHGQPPETPAPSANIPPRAAGTLDTAMRHQLRPPVADFAGRERETAFLAGALRAALAQGRGAIIGGVLGMGGVGKTELAYQVAHVLHAAFPDAQLLLNLRGSSAVPLSPMQALRTVIHAVDPNTRLSDELPALEAQYRSVLHGQRALLLADDARDAQQVQALIPPQGCALLITSRQRFSLPGMTTIDLQQLDDDAAVTLVRAICGRLSVAEAQAIARACGGLPLALRVSGSLLRNDPALRSATYIQRLAATEQRLAQLRDPDDPQWDVEASLTLSYAMLDGVVQRVFRHLGLLVADFAAALALAVVEAPVGVEVESALHLLLRRNLVMYNAQRGRWQLHELVRALALRHLKAAGEWEAAAWRYARAAVQIAQETQAQYLAGGDQALAALAWFDLERPHIDAARHWAGHVAATAEGDMLLLRHALATIQIGALRYDKRQERIPQLEQARAAARRLHDQHGERQILHSLGTAYAELGEPRRAIEYHEQALTLARAIADRQGEGASLNRLGAAYRGLGATRQAISYYEQALTLTRALGDLYGSGSALGNLGNAYTDLGEPRQAIVYYEQALVLAREIGNQHNEAKTLINLGIIHTDLGEPQRALGYCEQALTLACALGDRRGEGLALGSLGNAYWALGEAQTACGYCARALEIARADGDRRMEGYALAYLARATATGGSLAAATTLFEQALAILGEVGDRWGEAECRWAFGMALAQLGEQSDALPLLRAAVAYEQEIGHMKAAEHAALLARLAAGETLAPQLPAQAATQVN